MKIEQLFERDIHRPINGVVKADQLDEASVWQELDEFVVTRELTRHLHELVAVLLASVQGEQGVTTDNGVWVSGFFGCGKSHLVKILSYVLANQEHRYQGQARRAVDFFQDKLDPLLFADLKRVAACPTDTILFNVDSKADHSSGRDALLQVFLRVLNEKQGYSGDHPHIAHMERHLDERGRLGAFHAAFAREAGVGWVEERDAWSFHRDELLVAWMEALDQSRASAEAWADGAERSFALTVENLAMWVRRYLDGRGPRHRLVFLVDEVGGFIGSDTHLMLNLQTITEQLATICGGRAWVVVTSQEDLEAVLGDLKGQKQHDFSKIQGRFRTRVSLSSANVDEVIKTRLLAKDDRARTPLLAAYEGKHDILRNQLSFVDAGRTFGTYADVDEFATCYPFASYQFALVQRIFESIRKAGATGLHLSQGERSTLDAFQSAARRIGELEIGALIPLHGFYPAVKGFLDTAVKRTIEQAGDSHALEPFDATLLEVLFLIRYVDELPGNVDNLVTLCVDEIDADRLRLRRRIEAALARLEGETLIARNGDLYSFLTNEERDIGREIKKQDIPSGAEERELGKLLFEDLLGDARRHTYSVTQRVFSFNRSCDDHHVGNRLEGNLEVAFASPLGDRHSEFSSDEACVLHTSIEQGRLLIRLPDDPGLGRELRVWLQTDSYVRTRPTDALPETTRRFLRDRSEENGVRRDRILTILREMLAGASYFARGSSVAVRKTTPKEALAEALEYLIANAFPKMAYVEHLHSNARQEIQSTLRANDVEQVSLTVATPESNPQALADLREHVRLCSITSKQIVLHDLINKRYGSRPYGWPELEVVLLVSRLAVLKEVELVVGGGPLALDQAYDHLTSSRKQRKVVVRQRQVADQALIKSCQGLGQELFGQLGPAVEDKLFVFLKDRLIAWGGELDRFLPLAQTGDYPGLGAIRGGLGSLRKFTQESDSLRFLKRFVGSAEALTDLAEDYQDLGEFYGNQRGAWDTLRGAVGLLAQNRLQLDAHPDAAPALARMEAILALDAPYGALHEVAALIEVATTANDALVAEARAPAVAGIQGLLDGVDEELAAGSSDADLRRAAVAPLERLRATAESSVSIAHIVQAREAAEAAFDEALTSIEQARTPPEPDPELPPPTPDPPPPPPGTDPSPGRPDSEPIPRPPPPSPPRIRKRRVIAARGLCEGTFLETRADVESFLDRLRVELESALQAGERIQIK